MAHVEATNNEAKVSPQSLAQCSPTASAALDDDPAEVAAFTLPGAGPDPLERRPRVERVFQTTVHDDATSTDRLRAFRRLALPREEINRRLLATEGVGMPCGPAQQVLETGFSSDNGNRASTAHEC